MIAGDGLVEAVAPPPADLSRLRALPAVDEVLRSEAGLFAVERHGRQAAVMAARAALDAARAALRAQAGTVPGAADLGAGALAALEAAARPNVRAVYNLTGTVLHTNLGRAVLAEAAIAAATLAMRGAVALEFDIATGRRGERDDLVRDLLTGLTGAEDATLVNNNAAALMIVLNTLAQGREAVVSRGELIEIGGAFRLPDIMARSGVQLREIGTTNRTHFRDYREAVGPETGLLLKVHTSNFRVQGFTAEVGARELAGLGAETGVPLVNDLGSGTLVDLVPWGLAHEPTVAEAVAEGADLVTFSGDKLLGGPQAGFIVGRRDLIARINKNPMKRAMRVDKIRLAAIEATLRLYADPDRLADRLPTLRWLARKADAIGAIAARVAPAVAAAAGPRFSAEVAPCASQIGSGALPLSTLPSAAIRLAPVERKGAGQALGDLAAAFRALPVPVIGHIADDAFWLDCRCLDDEADFAANLAGLAIGPAR
ncbi:L-seryl-tRNA(Sec) selenium transferase [Methylobacterium sp. BTF04]|uniref:L-seryl-tRNA(Sec) selenium transferase n=1 Tax=Methylobacterium sp. BTF04 TaxID=2708300 RepID=UPI0013D1BEFB|nr:L-seryl-tRNA(Sec) selenium transferase [Methylobacterium sp. BTF04]NEU13274.1 L-seryl-tRNA(Sec) selenium transferase [Methylobacterium sp. BTF04]